MSKKTDEPAPKVDAKVNDVPVVVESPGIPADIKAGVESAIDDVVKNVQSEKAARESKATERGANGKFVAKPKEDLPPEEVHAGENAEDDTSANGKENADGKTTEQTPVEISDAHVERAVKAGLSIADARSFKDAKALERVCDTLEKAAKAPDKKDEKPNETAKDELLDEINAIPDLENEKDAAGETIYDDKIVATFKALKAIVLKQHGVIGELRKAGGPNAGNFLDVQIAALGEGYTEALGAGATSALDQKSEQAVKRSQLEGKFKVLEAGYKAAGQDVKPEEIFKEAASLVLGDVAAKVAEADKIKALAERSKQHVSRPGGSRTAPKSDPVESVAADVKKKFFNQ